MSDVTIRKVKRYLSAKQLLSSIHLPNILTIILIIQRLLPLT